MTDVLRDRPGYALRRAANAMMTDLARRLAEIDLRIAEASVLLLVDDRQDATASEIGRTLDIQRANMVPLLGRLEEAGLIERKPVTSERGGITTLRITVRPSVAKAWKSFVGTRDPGSVLSTLIRAQVRQAA